MNSEQTAKYIGWKLRNNKYALMLSRVNLRQIVILFGFAMTIIAIALAVLVTLIETYHAFAAWDLLWMGVGLLLMAVEGVGVAVATAEVFGE